MLSFHGVKHLLMGGQACVFYGAAEFSRDCDVVVFADSTNMNRLQSACTDLLARCIAVPHFDPQYLDRGHAVHFRCQHPQAQGMRLDVMTKMRGCDSFERLWERRVTLQDPDGCIIELIGIEDLVIAKKTQRAKDWPMIARLVDAHYERNQDDPTDDQIKFWLRESRNPDLLFSLSKKYPALFQAMQTTRKFFSSIETIEPTAIKAALNLEQDYEKQADEAYWKPLKAELQSLRLLIRTANKPAD